MNDVLLICTRIIVLILLSVSLGQPLQATNENGKDLSAREIEQLLKEAEARVFLVDTDKGGGSAVLLKVSQEDGQRIAYLATCYHVLFKSTELKIYDKQKNNLGDPKSIDVYLKPEFDLAIIRCPLRDVTSQAEQLDPVLAETNVIRGQNDSKDELLVIGYPFFRRSFLHESRVRFAPVGTSRQFTAGIFRSSEFRIRPVLGEPTSRGMSGGIVVGREFRFGGILLGRLRDTTGFVITADMVLACLTESLKPESEFRRFHADLVSTWENTPYTETAMEILQSSTAEFDDSLAWSLNANWQDIFADNTLIRERFQEISIDLDRLAEQDEGLKLKIEPATFALHPDGIVRISFNGQKYEFGKKGGVIDLYDNLVPGENLIVISRKLPQDSNRSITHRLNDFLDPLRLYFTLVTKDDRKLYSVRRELPVVFNGFSTFVTLNCSRIVEPVSHNAILAINLQRLGEYASLNPFEMKGYISDSKIQAGIDLAVLEPKIEIQGRSEQTAKFRMESQIKTGEFDLRYAGVHFKRRGSQDSKLEVDGVLQLIRYQKQYRLVGRFVGGHIDTFDLNLSDDLSIDIGTPLSELMVAGANNQLSGTVLDSRRLDPIRSSETRKVVDQLLPGLLGEDDEIRVTVARFQPDGWLVVGLMIGNVDEPVFNQLPVIEDENECLAQLQTFGIPKTDIERGLRRVLPKFSPSLQKSAVSLASQATVRWNVEMPTETREAYAIDVGMFGNWFDHLLGKLRSESVLEFQLGADSVVEAVRPWYAKVETNTITATGNVLVTACESGIKWSAIDLTFATDRLKQGNTTFENAQLVIEEVRIRQDANGEISGTARGRATIDRLKVNGSPVDFTSLAANFTATLADAGTQVVQVDMDTLQGSVAAGRISAETGSIRIEDGKMQGEVSIGGKLLMATFSFGEHSGVKVDSSVLSDAEKELKKLGNDAKKEGEKLLEKMKGWIK